jgi:ubiquinone/menaquinone biosynthesis C-methylase UbiE
VAVDLQSGMAAAARARLWPSASVIVADGRALPCQDKSFDLVLDRHAPVSLAELARVLAPRGALVTQQVGGSNLQSIFDAFGWGSNADQGANGGPAPSASKPSSHWHPGSASTL